MKIWYKYKAQRSLNTRISRIKNASVSSFAKATLIAVLVLSSSIIYFSDAHAAQTATDYCKTYTDTAQKNSCTDGFTYCAQYTASTANNACETGWADATGSGTGCSDYGQVFGSDIVGVCSSASTYHKNHPSSTTATADSGTGSNSNSSNNNSSNSNSSNSNSSTSNSSSSGSSGSSSSSTDTSSTSLLKTLQELQKASSSSQADNQYGSYTNGAGKQQALQVSRASGDNNPAIVFIDGGGWHSDDGMGRDVASKANARGYTTFVASYRLGSSGVYYMLDDVLRAMRHVINNAGMYGIDPNRVAIWGDSAGGSLAVRAASTGQSGAKVQVGWSTPTNAYTAIFKSLQTFAIGMDHSTCAPTDVNGVTDVIDQLNGGSGSNPNTLYQGGVGDNSLSNGSSGGSSSDALSTVTDVLTLTQQAQQASTSVESISKNLQSSSGQKTLVTNTVRLAAKKFLECIDNFNSASPALFASALSPPGFFAGYDDDELIDPGQAYEMRDKLRALGVVSEALILHGTNPSNDHLWKKDKGQDIFISPTLDFIDKFLQPNKGQSSSSSGSTTSTASTTPTTSSTSPSPSTSTASPSPSSSSQSSQSSSQPQCGDPGYPGTWTIDPSTGNGYCAPPASTSPAPAPAPAPAPSPVATSNLDSRGLIIDSGMTQQQCNKSSYKEHEWESDGCHHSSS